MGELGWLFERYEDNPVVTKIKIKQNKNVSVVDIFYKRILPFWINSKKIQISTVILANLNPGVLILEEKEDLSYLEQTTSELTCQGKYQFIYSNENMQFNCFLPGVYENL